MPIWLAATGVGVIAATVALSWWLRRFDEEK